MKVASFFAPGKLFIAGEYAVIQGGTALLLPIRLGIQVTITPQSSWEVENPNYLTKTQTFTSIETVQPVLFRIILNVFSSWLKTHGKVLVPCKIKIESDLGSKEEKYGFGSSGAIVIALLGALSQAYELSLTPDILFRLGVKVLHEKNPIQSFADLAVSAFQQPIQYQKWATTFEKKIDSWSLETLLKEPWPGLSILPFQPFFEKPWVVYTQVSANSKHIVPNILSAQNPSSWALWIEQSNAFVERFLKERDLNSLGLLQLHLASLKPEGLIMTSPIQTLMKIAHHHHVISKISGAGGGDCVLFWPTEKTNIQSLKNALKDFTILSVF